MNTDDIHLGSSTPASPLLLWLTTSAEYYSGDKHQLAEYLRGLRELSDAGNDDDKIAALYVLGEDGPKEAQWAITPHGTTEGDAASLTVTEDTYDVSVLRHLPDWV